MDSPLARASRLLWWVATGCVVALAVALGSRMPEADAALGCGVAMGAVTSLTVMVSADGTGTPWHHRARRALRVGVGVLISTGTVLVLATALGAAVLVPLALWALCSPPVVRRLGSVGPPDEPAPACETVDQDSARLTLHLVRERLSGLELEEVSLLWERSLRRLQAESDDRERGWLVLLRQLLLDELDRRDPVALRRWLVSEPRAGGDPTTYFGREEPPGRIAS